jgi:hypothetical protein
MFWRGKKLTFSDRIYCKWFLVKVKYQLIEDGKMNKKIMGYAGTIFNTVGA